MTPSLTLGFIGLGAMGGAVARRLAAGPWRVLVHDLAEAAVARAVAQGAVAAGDAGAAIAGADIAFTCLPTPELAEAFWQDHAARLREGAIAVDLSTVDPATSRRIATLVAAGGRARFAACTLGKTPAMAERGEIPVFFGADDPSLLETLRPVLAQMASTVFDMGSPEGATMFKLISNLVGMTNLVVLAEGLQLARATGIADDTFTAALKTTGGWSVQADIRLGWMAAADFAPRFAVDLATKDVRLSVDTAARRGVPTPVAAAALSVFSLARAAGLGAQDAAAVAVPLGPRPA
ncbi:NAD(P)-dependent oxidoreductase [Rhodovastum atsumiense]|uniref:NAD(P)-dependent oxidoreductase n=1 Tax=Rhodovastum atsumiense TaxID=504468 RepID=A0A5M6IW28_9PROT|nr:NAD(P)-dependent oxidoreductase [Rhodovastum atsumiense]KAA5612159.1 NAD(P)-dependent oxidoreductase [Rhodovastum atsumiense]CAH2603895.1 NAD(P)-dependent oxidoreductase [Rhodovastum atsumiense]